MIIYHSQKIPITSQGVYNVNIPRDVMTRHVKVKMAYNLTSTTDTFFIFESFSMFNGNTLLGSTGEQYFINSNYYYFQSLSDSCTEEIFTTPQSIGGNYTFRISSDTDPDATLTGTMILVFQISDHIIP